MQSQDKHPSGAISACDHGDGGSSICTAPKLGHPTLKGQVQSQVKGAPAAVSARDLTAPKPGLSFKDQVQNTAAIITRQTAAKKAFGPRYKDQVNDAQAAAPNIVWHQDCHGVRPGAQTVGGPQQQ